MGKVLKAETYRNLVASGGCNEIIQSLEVDGGQLVDDDRRLQFALFVNQFHDTTVIQTEGSTVDVLSVGIVTDTEDFRLIGIVDVKCKLAVRHYPIELRGNHTGQRNLGRCYLPLKLLLRSTEPCVHEGRKIVLQFRVGCKNGENVLVPAVKQFYCMGEGTVLATLIEP